MSGRTPRHPVLHTRRAEGSSGQPAARGTKLLVAGRLPARGANLLAVGLLASLLTTCAVFDGSNSATSGSASDAGAAVRHWPPNAEFQRSRLGLAVTESERLLDQGDVAEARRRLLELPATELEDGHVHRVLARIAMAEGRPHDVESHLDRATALLPLDPQLDLMRATFWEIYGDWDAARAAYAEAARKQPDAIEPIVAQVRVLLALGDREQAVALVERERKSRPLSVGLLSAAGFAYLANDRPDDAATAFDDALDLQPDDPDLLENLFLALARSGRHAEVVALAKQRPLEQLSPLACYTAGHSALLAEQPSLAVEALQLHVLRDRDDEAAWLDLARAHLLDQEHDAAFEALSKVLHVHPESAEALVLLGHVRSHVGQLSSAMSTYREAIRLGADGSLLAPVMLRLVECMQAGQQPDSLLDESSSLRVVRIGTPAGAGDGGHTAAPAGGSGSVSVGAGASADRNALSPADRSALTTADRNAFATADRSAITTADRDALSPARADGADVDPHLLAELLAGRGVGGPAAAPAAVELPDEALLPPLDDAGPADAEPFGELLGPELPVLPEPLPSGDGEA